MCFKYVFQITGISITTTRTGEEQFTHTLSQGGRPHAVGEDMESDVQLETGSLGSIVCPINQSIFVYSSLK